MNPRERLIIFTRYPEPGTTKTRLIACLGAEGAADLQRQMTARVLSQARALRDRRSLDLEVRHQGGSGRLMRTWLGDGVNYVDQGEGDLGQRMDRTLRDAVQQGALVAVLIGSDIPGITTALLAKAFAEIEAGKVVLGPATDGGYYLIGLTALDMSAASSAIFADMPWGTAVVLQETCRRLARVGLCYTLLDSLTDIDRPEDLSAWEPYRHK
jgi:uncharacterized protein